MPPCRRPHGQYSSDLRLHRHIGCLKMPQNEEQTFAMVEAMGESIYTARSWPQIRHKM